MFRFRRERRPTFDPRLKYQVFGVMLNLTGPLQRDDVSMLLPGMPEFGMHGRLVRLPMRNQDATTTLARIGAAALSRCVLPWISAMRGGGEPGNIEEWKRLADLEPDVQLRLQYATDALVFAELQSASTQWKQALEGWNVRVSQQILEWKAETQ